MMRTATIAAGVAAGAAAAVYGVPRLYEYYGERYLEGLQNRLPEGGQTESVIPYLAAAQQIADSLGLDYVLMGGMAKRALRDPESVIDPHARTVRVSDDPTCIARSGGLYRAEGTRVDADTFLYGFTTADQFLPATPSQRKAMAMFRENLQHAMDTVATMRGFPAGPDVSMFGYERPHGKFSLGHFSTRTVLEAGGYEKISHSVGAKGTFPPQDRWQLLVTFEGREYSFPITTPVRSLGRTLVRSLVLRERDGKEVEQGVANIRANDPDDTLLGVQWAAYEQLRHDIDERFAGPRGREALRSGHILVAAQYAVARYLAPRAPTIEASWLAKAIRDPGTRIGALANKLMGAQ